MPKKKYKPCEECGCDIRVKEESAIVYASGAIDKRVTVKCPICKGLHYGSIKRIRNCSQVEDTEEE